MCGRGGISELTGLILSCEISSPSMDRARSKISTWKHGAVPLLRRNIQLIKNKTYFSSVLGSWGSVSVKAVDALGLIKVGVVLVVLLVTCFPCFDVSLFGISESRLPLTNKFYLKQPF